MVKCSECGFLASRNVQTRRLEETELEIRSEGALSIAWNTEKPFDKYEPPICFMQAPDFKAIPYSTDVTYNRDKVSKEVYDEIQRDRECEFFTKWRQGFTPREHREMLDRQEWREWQAKSDREKIQGPLLLWSNKLKQEKARFPTDEEIDSKRQELLANLPALEDQLFGDLKKPP